MLPIDIQSPRILDVDALRPVMNPPLRDGEYYCEQRFTDCQTDQLTLERAVFDRVVLRQFKLPRTKAHALHLDDVIASGGDLANSEFTELAANRVYGDRIRATGLQVIAGKLRNLRLDQSRLDLSSFHEARLVSCHFDHCDFHDADFRDVIFEHVAFSFCDLRGARFSGPRPTHLDLRGSQLTDCQFDPKSLAGTIVDPSQLLDLARIIGLRVQPLPEADQNISTGR